MVPAITGMTATVRREQIPVRAEAMLCNRCGFQVMTDAQSDAYTIASRRCLPHKAWAAHTKELKQIRQRLGMSFRTFARHLKVSEAARSGGKPPGPRSGRWTTDTAQVGSCDSSQNVTYWKHTSERRPPHHALR